MDITAIMTIAVAFFFLISSAVVAVRIGYRQATADARSEIRRTTDAQIAYWRENKQPLPKSPSRRDG